MMHPTWSHAQNAHRLVLRRGAGSQPLIDAAAELGWPLVNIDDGDPAWARPRIMTFQVPDTGIVAEWVEDQVIEIPYVAIHGPDAESVARELAGRIGARSITELLDVEDATAQKDAPLKRVSALSELAVAAPLELEPRILDRLVRALHDAHPSIRAAAVLAINYRPWKEYRPALEKARAAEDVQAVRRDLDSLLAEWDAIAMPRDPS